MQSFKKVIKLLKQANKTVSTMESCTGGGLANTITNVEGASEVIEFSAVTYSNEYKIKMGVDPKIINQYTVYSIETAKEMSKQISNFSNSDYGVGITGKLNRVDKKNPYGEDNIVYISIYDKSKKSYHTTIVEATLSNRKDNKKKVIQEVESLFLSILQ